MTKYASGATFERKVRKDLEGFAWRVTRSAGSKGTADLVAVAPGPRVALVQCKRDAKLSSVEREILVTDALAYDCVPILAYKDKKEIVYLELNNHGAPTPWHPGGAI